LFSFTIFLALSLYRGDFISFGGGGLDLSISQDNQDDDYSGGDKIGDNIGDDSSSLNSKSNKVRSSKPRVASAASVESVQDSNQLQSIILNSKGEPYTAADEYAAR
jgi:hypothetical protein